MWQVIALTSQIAAIGCLTYAYVVHARLTKSLKELNYWLTMAHNKENEVKNLKERINQTITKSYF